MIQMNNPLNQYKKKILLEYELVDQEFVAVQIVRLNFLAPLCNVLSCSYHFDKFALKSPRPAVINGLLFAIWSQVSLEFFFFFFLIRIHSMQG